MKKMLQNEMPLQHQQQHQQQQHLQQLVHFLFVVIVIVILIFPTGLQSYNVDERTAVVRTGENETQFGFTVAFRIENNRRSFLVGAPKAQTTQPNVFRGGAVFKCSLDRLDCEIIPFDEQGNQREWNGSSLVVVEDKTLQWFGATLTASQSGNVLACAPRYVYFSRNGLKREPVGTCYLSRPDSRIFTRYSPCRKDHLLGQRRLGSCQSGFSAAFTTDSNYLILGAVGSYFWQGQVHTENLRENDSMQSTEEGPSTNDYNYMGYAVASGNFSLKYGPDFVVGTPRGNSLTGKISFLDQSLRPFHELRGEQIGEYFGSSIAVGDFNGDGFDDVAVGAPFYSSSASHFDIGRVYVFHQTTQRDFGVDAVKLSSSRRPSSRFGLTVVSLGDVDLDGRDDLAVGAPYDGPNGNGAVYIFHGSLEGIRSKESQVCYAESFGSQLSAFGYSLSAGSDLDQNGYPDLLVGAYKADAVILLRSRPVVRVKAEVRIEPEVIDLEDKSCRLPDGTPVACFTVTFCANYSGLKVPSSLQFSLDWKLDSLKMHSLRSAFLEAPLNSTTTVKMTALKLHQNCTSMLAYIKDRIRDKLSPIVVEVGYSLVESNNVSSDEPQPVLDIYESHPAVAQGHILKNCGVDHVCIPDLVVHASSSKSYYVLGTDNEVELNIVVENNGEDAFETTVRIEMPPGVVYINVNNMNATDEVVCDSQRPENSTVDYVTCDIGNPLSAGNQVAFSIRTSASRVSQISTDVLQFLILANSSNQENTTSLDDNFNMLNIPVKAILNIKLTGASFPEQVLHNFTDVSELLSEADIGPPVSHLYEIRNFGPGVVGRMHTVIKWPSKTYDGSHLFYLLEEPRVVLGRGRCWTDAVNPLNLTLLPNDSDEIHIYDYLKGDLDPIALRTKRQIAPQFETLVRQITCGETMTGCAIIECETGPMSKDDSVLIRIRARVFFRTIVQMQTDYRGIFVRSEVRTSVVAVPYAVEPEVYITDVFRLETFVAALGVGQHSQPIEFWMIAVGIFGGCLLLFLIILIMWKCGFFARQHKLAMHQGQQVKYESVKNENPYRK